MRISPLLFILFIGIRGYSQDTLIIREPHNYSSKKVDLFNAHYKIIYGEKHITYPDGITKVIWNYYLDSNENQFSKSYRIKDDSILQILNDSNAQEWKFHKTINNLYSVVHEDNETIEKGIVSSLIPFEKKGIFTVYSKFSQDTLWKIDYSGVNYKGPVFILPYYTFPKVKTDSLYKFSELDLEPKWANGDSIHHISLKRMDHCWNESMQAIRTLKFIIDENGIPRNFEQYEGNFFLHSCPFYFQSLIKKILSQSPFIPGVRNGKNVSSICYLQVDMVEEYLNKYAKHPAFDHREEKPEVNKKAQKKH